MNIENLVSVTNCPKCGFKIIQPYRKRPNSIFGNKLSCPKCKHKWIVTWSIIRDKDETGGILEYMVSYIQQTLLSEFSY